MANFPIVALVLGPIVAYLIRQALFSSVAEPSLDYGTGGTFDIIAGRYDAINRVLALGMDMSWRRRMVDVVHESVKTLDSPRILDLATGTADVAILLSKHIPNAAVIGVDPSPKMLQIGRSKVTKGGYDKTIDLREFDARDLSTLASDEEKFDAATMAFGIRNVVPNRETALCQIHSILKPGARFCILEFSEPDENSGFLGMVARQFIRHVIPTVGGILSGAPRAYWHLQNSIENFPSVKEFDAQLEQLECGERGGAFRVDDLIQLNFGAVQVHVLTAIEKIPEAVSRD